MLQKRNLYNFKATVMFTTAFTKNKNILVQTEIRTSHLPKFKLKERMRFYWSNQLCTHSQFISWFLHYTSRSLNCVKPYLLFKQRPSFFPIVLLVEFGVALFCFEWSAFAITYLFRCQGNARGIQNPGWNRLHFVWQRYEQRVRIYKNV